VPGAAQRPGRAHADHTGTEDQQTHRLHPETRGSEDSTEQPGGAHASSAQQAAAGSERRLAGHLHLSTIPRLRWLSLPAVRAVPPRIQTRSMSPIQRTSRPTVTQEKR
jgi:hypothetical protein